MSGILKFLQTKTAYTASSSSSKDVEPASDSSDSELDESGPPNKKTCRDKSRPLKSKRKYSKNWEKDFYWLVYDEDIDGAFCKVCKQVTAQRNTQHTGGVWVSKPFTNWKKATEKMRAHEKSTLHTTATQALLITSNEGSIAHQMQRIGMVDREKNRNAMKALIRCTHFLTRHHIAHTTNFSELVDLVVSCGSRELQVFLDNATKNAVYTSHRAVADFIEALAKWVEESTLKRLQSVPFFSVMADECTDVTTIEELSVFCRWEENGVPVECFLEIIPLKKADAKSIYLAIVKCLKEKNLQVSNIVGMGFDGASTFSGKKTGVQARLKKHSPHALFVHCHCHMLQLACVQAANSTPGIKHVYITLTTLWKYFHYSPKRAESLKAIQNVLELPELKVIKPSDTRWLAHERCVKAVKASYTALVVTLDSNYENFHEPEALGLHKALSKFISIAAIYLLDYILPNVAKLSKTMQTKQLDLSAIYSESVLQSLDDAITPAANWVLELLDSEDDIKQATGETISIEKIQAFQEKVGTPFVALLKQNISNRFSSCDILSALAIFDPKKVPSSNSSEFSTYGKKSIEILLHHYGTEKPALTINDENTMKSPLINEEVHTEWITFRRLLAEKPKDDIALQLQYLITDDMLITMFPNLHKLATVCVTIPVSTASVERSFSQMKLIKTRLRNSLNEVSLSQLMKIAIESPEKLDNSHLEEILDIWNKKPRRISI
ncbi:zinc finger MYM-type protein 1-like [Dysidea avara]|uniref:zinc finger MYM-type protein 1-like n=1 Tax=Dysidea avara TaxID=196820 RepID=UPI00331C996D